MRDDFVDMMAWLSLEGLTLFFGGVVATLACLALALVFVAVTWVVVYKCFFRRFRFVREFVEADPPGHASSRPVTRSQTKKLRQD